MALFQKLSNETVLMPNNYRPKVGSLAELDV